MSTDDKIQDTLQKLRAGGHALRYAIHDWYNGIAESEVQQIITTLKGYGLIVETEKTEECRLTTIGFEVADTEGGWVKYRKRVKEQAELDFILKQTTVTTNHLTQKGLFLTALFTGLSLCVAFFSLWIADQDYHNNRELLEIQRKSLNQDSEMQKIKSERDSLKRKLIEIDTARH